jgi:hypothetical protein
MSLDTCIKKISTGKMKIDPDLMAALREKTELYKSQGLDKDSAEKRAVAEEHANALADHAEIKSEIQDQLKLTDTTVKAEAEPRNAEPEAPQDPNTPSRAFGVKEKELSRWEQIKQFTGMDKTNPFDNLGNKFLGKSFSVLKKLTNAGEYGAHSKLEGQIGGVSGEAANAQGNNAMGVVSQAMAIGHMVIDKAGRVIAKESPNDFKKLSTHYKDIRQALADMGYKESEPGVKDPNSLESMMTLAILGPRMKELVRLGEIPKEYYTAIDAKISEKLRNDPKLAPHLKEFHGTYNDMRGHALEAMVNSGLYTRDKANELMNRGEYFPLYRVDSEMMGTGGDVKHISSLVAAAKEYHLGEGNAFAIGDPMLNAFNNLVWLNTRAVKNNTANILAKSLVAVKQAEWRKTAGSNGKDPSMIELMRDGAKAYLKLEDVNDASAFAASPVMTGFGWKLMRVMSNSVRRGVTTMPGFVWGQTFQDAQRVAVMTGQGHLKSLKDTAVGLVKGTAGKSSAELETLRSYGVVGARDFTEGVDQFRKDMLEKKESAWWHAKKHLEQMSNASDGAAREAAYKKRYEDVVNEYRKNGQEVDVEHAKFEAQHAARMLIDFNNKGNSRTLAALMTVVPFVNARIQGTHRMVDALQGKIAGVSKEQAQHAAMMKVGQLMAFTLAYSAYSADDDEYKNSNQVIRDGNFLLAGFKMPVANELLPFKTLAETTYREMTNNPNEDWSKSKASIGHALSQLLMGPADMMPSLVKPLVESATNHSFATGHDLVSKSLLANSPDKQYTNSTSWAAKEISSGLESSMNLLGLHGVSPIVLENFLTGFTGRAGQEALRLMNNIESGVGDRAAPKKNEWVGVGAFFSNPEGNAERADFQEVRTKVDAATADLKKLMDEKKFTEAQEFRKEHAPLLALHSRLTPIEQQLAQVSKQSRIPGITAEQKTALYHRQLQILKQVGELRKAAGFDNII